MSEIRVRGRTYNHIHVIIDGQEIHSFESLRVSQNINSLAGSFNVSFPNKWITAIEQYPFLLNKEIKLAIDGLAILLTGYIESVNCDTSANSHAIRVMGRSKTADIIDCSPHNVKQFNNQTLQEIATEICRPFGINVINKATMTLDKFPKASMRVGETAWNFLNRLAKQQAVLLNTDQDGNIEINEVGKVRLKNSILDSRNVIDFQVSSNMTQIFDSYSVSTQLTTQLLQLNDQQVELENAVVVLAEHKSTRPGIRHRPFTMIAEKNLTEAQAQGRAMWEDARRKADVLKSTLHVNGWVNGDGELWRPNTIVNVDYQVSGIKGEYLISSVGFSIGATQSLQTAITLVDKNAYQIAPSIDIDKSLRFNLDAESYRKFYEQNDADASLGFSNNYDEYNAPTVKIPYRRGE